MPDKQRAYLILENGEVFEGEAFGALGEVTGETVFTTGMIGYPETLTDPGHYGQIVVQTFPMIGNYGVIKEDFESPQPAVAGYIVKQWCQDPSNFRSEGDLDAFLRSRNIVGLCGVDTRRLTKLLRNRGVMNGRITTAKPDGVPDGLREHRVTSAVAACSVKTAYTRAGSGTAKLALLDLGVQNSMVNAMLRRASELTVYPYDTPAAEILAAQPDGIVISGGGNPFDLPDDAVIANVRTLADSGVPVFGVNLGHLVLARAFGFTVTKLKYGHHGANQPAKDAETDRTHITSQNHGYAVDAASLDAGIAREWLVNVNDGTNEGIVYTGIPVISVQFHPEPSAKPCDTSFVIDKFMVMISERNVYAAR